MARSSIHRDAHRVGIDRKDLLITESSLGIRISKFLLLSSGCHHSAAVRRHLLAAEVTLLALLALSFLALTIFSIFAFALVALAFALRRLVRRLDNVDGSAGVICAIELDGCLQSVIVLEFDKSDASGRAFIIKRSPFSRSPRRHPRPGLARRLSGHHCLACPCRPPCHPCLCPYLCHPSCPCPCRDHLQPC